MELDLRKQRILQAIVQDYIATAEPVGSHVLVERYALGVKSATIRNEMAEMSEWGYLRQPHTSAGRVPSSLGYRFYVNRLMTLPPLRPVEIRRMRTAVATVASELEAILRKTCQLLTQMTQLPALATPPDADDTELRQVFLSAAGTDKALLVLLFSTGRTENRLLTHAGLTATDALILANALNERFAPQRLAALRSVDATPPPPETARHHSLWLRVAREIATVARDLATPGAVFLEGAQTALAQPEFRDVERLSQFLTLVQERAALLEMMSQALEEPLQPFSVAYRIGDELSRPELSEYAVVAAPYRIGTQERGSIGVIGPIRMDYGRASVAVGFLAETVSELLTHLAAA